MPSFKERVDQHDREIAAIRKLIHAGMKMLVKSDQNLLRLEGEIQELRASQKQTDRQIQELRASQTETDRQLQALIRSMRGEGNGHVKGRIE